MINLLRNQITKEQHSIINFDYFEDTKDTVVEHWTGLNKENFSRLLNTLPSLRYSEQRYTECALAVYLAKLKTGHTDQQLADIFTNDKRSTAERLIKSTKCTCGELNTSIFGIFTFKQRSNA